MRIATWNVNSIRARHRPAHRLAGPQRRRRAGHPGDQDPDDDKFPAEPFTDLGYQVAHHGINQWNGVAVLSRVGLRRRPGRRARAAGLGRPGRRRGQGDRRGLRRRPGVEPVRPERPGGRRSALRLQAGVAGRAARLRREAAGRRPARADRVLRRLQHRARPTTTSGASSTTATPPTSPRRSGRPSPTWSTPASPTWSARTHPGPGVYTYWDYTQLSFPKRRGMRIDFALASPALAARVTGASIDREERKGKLPSDHAPVIVELAGLT